MSWKLKSNGENGVHHIQCSFVQSMTVYLESKTKTKIELLMDAYPNQEWAGYMVGNISASGSVFVEDISIPPHYGVSGGYAEVDKPSYNKETGKYDFHIPKNCVGFIHSHDSMGAFHSGTDDAHVDRNFPVSITVAKRQGQSIEFDCISYAKTPCKKMTVTKAEVRYVSPKPDFDTVEWLEQAKANIDKPRVTRAMMEEILQKPLFVDAQGVPVDDKGLPYSDFKDTYVPVRYRVQKESGKVIPEEKGRGWGNTGINYTVDENGVVMTVDTANEVIHSPDKD